MLIWIMKCLDCYWLSFFPAAWWVVLCPCEAKRKIQLLITRETGEGVELEMKHRKLRFCCCRHLQSLFLFKEVADLNLLCASLSKFTALDPMYYCYCLGFSTLGRNYGQPYPNTWYRIETWLLTSDHIFIGHFDDRKKNTYAYYLVFFFIGS